MTFICYKMGMLITSGCPNKAEFGHDLVCKKMTKQARNVWTLVHVKTCAQSSVPTGKIYPLSWMHLLCQNFSTITIAPLISGCHNTWQLFSPSLITLALFIPLYAHALQFLLAFVHNHISVEGNHPENC